MKTFLKILLGLAIAGAGVVALVFWLTADLPRAADQFFTLIAKKDYAGALALTTPDFRASSDQAALEAFAQSSGLDGYRSATWSSRAIENNVGKLEGTITVADGGVIPVSMQLVKADGQWRIQRLDKSSAGLSTRSSNAADAPPATAPPEPAAEATPNAVAPVVAEQERLVSDTMALFAESVNANDFTALHAAASSRFQEQVPVEKLQESFAGFVADEVDLSALSGLTPQLDAQSGVDGDGILHLLGDYETQPSAVQFDLSYEQEDQLWRLVNIHVTVK